MKRIRFEITHTPLGLRDAVMSADIWLEAKDCCAGHSQNITHNLGPMFREAGVDWHDYEDGDRTALYLGREAAVALQNLIDYPEKFRPMSAPNGWGTYEQAIPFLALLVIDCARHPEAIVRVSL